MKMKIIETKNAPAAIGPYSQAIKAGDFLYASGQIPINPENGEIILSEGLGRNAFSERPSLGRYDSNKDKW